MSPEESGCRHLSEWKALKKPLTHECAECVKNGGRWVHLRTCQTCGVTLCCDSSPNRHASGHFRETGHPIVQSAEPGESWSWCFVDETVLA